MKVAVSNDIVAPGNRKAPFMFQQSFQRADAVRDFNRFYTAQIGLLDEHLLRSGFSLTEARILFELGGGDGLTSSDLRQQLRLDAGYLSRVMTGLEQRNLISRSRSETDARAYNIQLTNTGREVLAGLEKESREAASALLERLAIPHQGELLQAMAKIKAVLGEQDRAYVLRDPRPGDMGLVVQQQAELYAREYGWNSEFEALLAEICAKFLREHDPSSDRCWIAERAGSVVGSIFVVRHDNVTAKIRMLYVDASARGMGIGNRLVDETILHAQRAGYRRMILWTTSNLTAARKIYQRAGFKLVEEEVINSFGHELMSQTWALDLD